MSTEAPRPPDENSCGSSSGGLEPFSPEAVTLKLGDLHVGARLVVRCRKDWRVATVAFIDEDAARVILSIGSPTGHTYRLRRPTDAPLKHDGPIPILGEGHWRSGLVRYDVRW